jgi:hypothetical protein
MSIAMEEAPRLKPPKVFPASKFMIANSLKKLITV